LQFLFYFWHEFNNKKMKKLFTLLVVAGMFTFTACDQAEKKETNTEAEAQEMMEEMDKKTEEVSEAADEAAEEMEEAAEEAEEAVEEAGDAIEEATDTLQSNAEEAM
jgi:hypothetical protein